MTPETADAPPNHATKVHAPPARGCRGTGRRGTRNQPYDSTSRKPTTPQARKHDPNENRKQRDNQADYDQPVCLPLERESKEVPHLLLRRSLSRGARTFLRCQRRRPTSRLLQDSIEIPSASPAHDAPARKTDHPFKIMSTARASTVHPIDDIWGCSENCCSSSGRHAPTDT